MKEDVSVGKHVHVVVARVTALRSSGFVGPQHFAVGIGNGEDVFSVGCGNENETLGLKERHGCEAEEKNEAEFFHSWNMDGEKGLPGARYIAPECKNFVNCGLLHPQTRVNWTERNPSTRTHRISLYSSNKTDRNTRLLPSCESSPAYPSPCFPQKKALNRLACQSG